jgi:electron transfer flavoprotein alpha subunit
MKALLVGEYREGKVLDGTYELVGFARRLGAEALMFLVGDGSAPPQFDGRLFLADVSRYGEFNPAAHKQLLLEVIEREQPDIVAFLHSSYGWDLAPRVALALGAGQVSEVIDVSDDGFVVPACNAKLRRTVKVASSRAVVTLQAGAFASAEPPSGTPTVEPVATEAPSDLEFVGYEQGEAGGVDLSKAEVIVSAGRGIGKKENVEVIARLAAALGGELGASRPVVDAGWVEHSRQVGTTGQTVAPKLYVACGISGAIQHVAGMKRAGFIVAINKDKDAPIGEVADVLVVADVLQLASALTEKLQG